MYFLGYDLGSSSLKASLLEAETGNLVASANAPEVEMKISSPQPGWAEQDPEIWWENLKVATHALLQKADINSQEIRAIGIAYQMHGLVAVDNNQQVLRASLIWCDSRAVAIGEQAFQHLGEEYCLNHLLNSPGNFTASKLKWVQENEPALYEKIHKIMLPGDYLAMRLTGEINTTLTGLSEGTLWDYLEHSLPKKLLEYYGFDPSLMADVVPVFANQGKIKPEIAQQLGLNPDVVISYRAGDQPNNAFSLKVLHPGETATTAGTSGVIYGIVEQPTADPQSRVNTFVHVNHQVSDARYGVLLCVNGTGIMNHWLQKTWQVKGHSFSYTELNELAAGVPIGSEGLSVLPFGNGAERVLQNQNLGASFHHLDLNRHTQAHLIRAVQEGIVFSLGYGLKIFEEMGLQTQVIRAGQANMFLSPLFCEAFVNITNARLELYNTDGAQGAARGAGLGYGYYQTESEAFLSLRCLQAFEPAPDKQAQYQTAYRHWEATLNQMVPQA